MSICIAYFLTVIYDGLTYRQKIADVICRQKQFDRTPQLGINPGQSVKNIGQLSISEDFENRDYPGNSGTHGHPVQLGSTYKQISLTLFIIIAYLALKIFRHL
jgi:hypothetical protein